MSLPYVFYMTSLEQSTYDKTARLFFFFLCFFLRSYVGGRQGGRNADAFGEIRKRELKMIAQQEKGGGGTFFIFIFIPHHVLGL